MAEPTEKEALQERARERGLDVSGTIAELKDRLGDSDSDGDSRELKHTMGGSTTRDDRLDAGAPMLPGSPKERVGPEDALGQGPKRGDYTGRVDPLCHESVPNPDAGKPILDPKTGTVVDFEPHSVLVAQAPRAEDIGDAPGKGGVDTALAATG